MTSWLWPVDMCSVIIVRFRCDRKASSCQLEIVISKTYARDHYANEL